MLLALLSNLFRLLLYPLLALRRARAAPRGAYVQLVLDGPVADLVSPRPRFRLPGLGASGKPPLGLRELRDLSRLIAHDDRITGLLVELRHVAAGPAVLASLRDLLSEVRASGKDLVAYLPHGADNKLLYLASAARRIVVGPETMVTPLGYAVEGRYVRRALERVGIEPQVFAKGMYKSAGEVLIRDQMSDAQREQVGALLEAHHDALAAALGQGRHVDRETAIRWIDEAPHRAERAVELGIVDAIAYEDELERAILGDRPSPKGGWLVPAARYAARRGATRLRPLRGRRVLGVIELHGPIVGRTRFAFSRVASEERVIAAVRAARSNPSIAGVVLHIDSPGGGAVASDRIHHEVTRLAEVKPVVAYLSNVAASGGYYVAVAAHALVAQPQTVTGSIGVVSARFVLGPLLERLGVFTDVVKRGARADLFSSVRRFDEGERAIVQAELDAFYRTFLKVVARGRGKTVEAIEPLAQGRVYSGTDAHARGLVDYLGGFDRALHELRELLGDAGRGLEPRLVRPPRSAPPPPRPLAQVPAVLEALGVGSLLEGAELAADVQGERVLLFWEGAEVTA